MSFGACVKIKQTTQIPVPTDILKRNSTKNIWPKNNDEGDYEIRSNKKINA